MQLNDARQKRENRQRNPENACEGLGGIAKQGERIGNDSNEVLDSNSARGNQFRAQTDYRGQGNTGKILAQMRELKQSHLTHADENKKALEKKISENEAYRQKTLDEMNKLENLLEELLTENKTNDE